MFMSHLFRFKGYPAHFLQIGAYTGDATEWLFDNILTHPESTLTDVDTWEGSDEPEHKTMDWKSVEDFYTDRHQSKIDSGRLRKLKMTSDEYFYTFPEEKYDFVYIDGDHKAATVLRDGLNTLNVIKTGGIIGFDDYTWTMNRGPAFDPKPAIDAVRLCFSDRLVTLELGSQAWLQAIN